MARPAAWIALALCATNAQPVLASTQSEPEVVIRGMRDPELKPYRVMLAGLDAFDDQHALAPKANALRYKLSARGVDPAAPMSALTLRIVGDTSAIALPLADDGSFALPRSAQADKEDADLVLNKKRNAYRWQPDIHSAGVPDGMRRLGDLRLECQVMVATAKKEIGFVLRSMLNTLLLTGDWCMADKVNIPTYSARAIDSATLVSGERRVALEIYQDRKGYVPPLRDRSYPDDSLIEIVFAPDSVDTPQSMTAGAPQPAQSAQSE